MCQGPPKHCNRTTFTTQVENPNRMSEMFQDRTSQKYCQSESEKAQNNAAEHITDLASIALRKMKHHGVEVAAYPGLPPRLMQVLFEKSSLTGNAVRRNVASNMSLTKRAMAANRQGKLKWSRKCLLSAGGSRELWHRWYV